MFKTRNKALVLLCSAGLGVIGLKAVDNTSRGLAVNVATPHQIDALEKLMEAIARNDLDDVHAHLSSGLDVNALSPSHKWMTPLMLASEKGNLGLVGNLLNAGAQIDALQKASQKTALMFAVENNRQDVVSLLLAVDADVQRPDALGNTPLMRAAEKGYAGIVNQLLASGADVNAQNKSGLTALDKASRHNRGDIVAILNQHSTLSQASSGLASVEDSTKKDPNQAKERQNKASKESRIAGDFILAAMLGDLNEMERLLDHGVDVNVNPESGVFAGTTALIQASLAARDEAVEFLLQRGVDVNGRDHQDKTALDLVAEEIHRLEAKSREDSQDPKIKKYKDIEDLLVQYSF